MVLFDQENIDGILDILKSCGSGSPSVTAMICRSGSSEKCFAERCRDFISDKFFEYAIDEVETIKEDCFSHDPSSVTCVVFKNGSLFFVYEDPEERRIPFGHTIVCSYYEQLFNADIITKSAEVIEVSDLLLNVLNASHTGNVEKTNVTVSDTDAAEEWIKFLKIVK